MMSDSTGDSAAFQCRRAIADVSDVPFCTGFGLLASLGDIQGLVIVLMTLIFSCFCKRLAKGAAENGILPSLPNYVPGEKGTRRQTIAMQKLRTVDATIERSFRLDGRSKT